MPGSLVEGRRLAINSVRADHLRVRRYGRVELTVDLHGSYSNPYDPAEIELDGLVTTPSGRRLVVPGFYAQDFTRLLRGGREQLSPRGKASWKLRICATEPGDYRVIAVARDRSARQAAAQPVRFTAVPSTDPGFVRRSPHSPAYFAFDSGAAYVPIGANICWGNGPGTFSYDRWLAAYGAAKCNYGRLWLEPSFTTFCMDRQGVGRIDLGNAWRLDYVLNLAEKHGLYLMLCLDSYNELRYARDGASPFWEQTALNAANGGPLREPADFWTSQEMERLYRDKLRYLVARYGADTHVLAWEFWNEVDIISPAEWNEDRVRAWHGRMARYLHGLDSYHHLITTSFSSAEGKPSIDRLPELDFVQTHTYDHRDLAGEVLLRQQQKAVYGKPHAVGECGLGDTRSADKTGISLHSALWSGIFSGGAGSGMLWWWDNYIEPNDLYHHFAALTGFMRGVDPIRSELRPDEQAALRYAHIPRRPQLSDLEISANDRAWEPSPANRPTQVWVTGEGDVRVDTRLSGLLHGVKNHPNLHNPVTFHIDLPRPTTLAVEVSGVSGYGGGRLVIRRGGAMVVDKAMPNPDRNGKTDTLHQYDGEYTVAVPPGPQTVVVENTGIDWMDVGYVLKKGHLAARPPLRVLALRGPYTTLAWVQNPESEWYRVLVQKQVPHRVPASILELRGLADGRYQVTLWDTYRGVETRRLELLATRQRLAVPLPEIQRDLALKAVRME